MELRFAHSLSGKLWVSSVDMYNAGFYYEGKYLAGIDTWMWVKLRESANYDFSDYAYQLDDLSDEDRRGVQAFYEYVLSNNE